jgi:hypothetical protein
MAERPAKDLADRGMGTFSGPQNFPIRNRVIAGCRWVWWSSKVRNNRLADHRAPGDGVLAAKFTPVPGNATQPTSFGRIS